MMDKWYLIRFTEQTLVVSGDESFSTSCYGRETFTNGNVSLSQREIYALLICLQFKINTVPKCHLLGWQSLIPLTCSRSISCCSQENPPPEQSTFSPLSWHFRGFTSWTKNLIALRVCKWCAVLIIVGEGECERGGRRGFRKESGNWFP